MERPILVVEDDRSIAELVQRNLEAIGLRCVVVHEGDLALGAVREHQPRLLVLDLMLPGLDGLEITRRLRATSDVPVLILTARGEESDKILGFELGADDYLTKPFSPRELVARVRALLRRTGSTTPGEVLARGDLRIDAGRRVIEKGGRVIEVTTLEFELLQFLAARPGRVFSREDLMREVWGEDRVVDTRSIDSLVSRLRRKLETGPDDPRYVQTVWGAGYRFTEDLG